MILLFSLNILPKRTVRVLPEYKEAKTKESCLARVLKGEKKGIRLSQCRSTGEKEKSSPSFLCRKTHTLVVMALVQRLQK